MAMNSKKGEGKIRRNKASIMINSQRKRSFFYLSKYLLQCTNNLQSTKINQNNMIKMSQTINITLQPMQ